MDGTLRQKTLGALIWNILDRTGQMIASFLVAIIVANLLDVEDYAITGMLALFSALANLLIDSGFNSALIQKRTVDDRDLSSVFWLNLTLSLVIYGLLSASAPLIADFFGQPSLLLIAPVVFLSIPLNAMILVQSAILNRQINFKPLAKANVLSALLSGALSILLALLGAGVWALVIQAVSLSLFRSLLIWSAGKWRPSGVFDFGRIQSLMRFAMNLLMAGLLNTLFLNLMSLLIGKLYPARQIGYYSQGGKFSDPLVTLVYSSIQNATYPVLSRIKDERDRLIEGCRQCLRLASMVALPLMAGLLVCSKPLIELLFKEDWWPAIPFLRWMCLGGAFTILTQICNNFIKASGHARHILKLEIWKILLLASGILMSFRYGALAMVASFAAVRILVFLINMRYVEKTTGYQIIGQARDMLPFLMLTVLMGGIIWPLEAFISQPLMLLALETGAGACFYILALRSYQKTYFLELVHLLRSMLNRQKSTTTVNDGTGDDRQCPDADL